MDLNKVYSLEELLAGTVTMVIPDMQRDYCWGDRAAQDVPSLYKADTFVRGVLHMFRQRRNIVVGLLYGYEHPANSSRIHIIDGQQRLTTLYLLAGMLYRRTPSDEMRQLLISDYKLIDDHEPRILYQARREAFYFMSDLVTNFFLNRDGRLSLLEKSNWYYASYDADPSVQSFISAIRQIDQALEEEDAKGDFDFKELAQYVRHSVRFLYCGFPDRPSAEKTFITINTTGEPLTLSQKLRALCIALHPADKELPVTWNQIEDWFWENRQICDIEKAMELYVGTLPSPSEFTVEDMMQYTFSYMRLVRCCSMAPVCRGGADFIEVGEFAIIPTIAFIRHFGDRASDADVRRFCHLLCNIAKYQRPTASGSDTELAVEMADSMHSPDILSLLRWHGAPKRLINDEERAKLEFILQHSDERELAERIVACAEAHPAVNGRASRILPWCEGDLKTMRHYVDRLYEIFDLRTPCENVEMACNAEIDKQPPLDWLRRALLTVRHREYPIVRRGNTVLSLCWNDYDWQRLLISAPGLIRQIIDRCDSGGQDAQPLQVFKEMAYRFSDKGYPYHFIIKNEATINYARKRQLMRPCRAFLGVYDIEEQHPRWWVEQIELKCEASHWMPLRAYGSRCLYTDHLIYNIAIDLYYNPEDKHKYRIEVFSRPDVDESARRPYSIQAFISDLDEFFMYDRQRKRHFAVLHNATEAVQLFQALLKVIECGELTSI